MPILNHLIKSLEENLSELERAYNEKDFESFNKTKKVMIHLQKKISEVTQ